MSELLTKSREAQTADGKNQCITAGNKLQLTKKQQNTNMRCRTTGKQLKARSDESKRDTTSEANNDDPGKLHTLFVCKHTIHIINQIDNKLHTIRHNTRHNARHTTNTQKKLYKIT